MTKRTLALSGLGIGLVALAFAAIATDRTRPGADRIHRIENGLLPAAVIAGEPATMNLAERMSHYKVPGVSVAVIEKGEIAWAKGYGVLAAHGTVPVTTETRFQAASISKPVAAMGALALVQQRRLSLDEDVNLTLTSWHVPDSEFTKDQKVTLRRLLSHSAGLIRDDVGSYAADEAVPNLVQALAGRMPANLPALRVESVPGRHVALFRRRLQRDATAADRRDRQTIRRIAAGTRARQDRDDTEHVQATVAGRMGSDRRQWA